MRAQLSVIEAGISAIIIISAAVAVADAAYGMSALQRTDSTNISNLA